VDARRVSRRDYGLPALLNTRALFEEAHSALHKLPVVRTAPGHRNPVTICHIRLQARLSIRFLRVIPYRLERKRQGVDIPSANFQLRMTFEFVRCRIACHHNA
jgi:hypothetical protein